ncbi:MAG: N-terminal methylation [candidate division NC10 bacterium]|nr:N-terminal methylation [candidate division NC10 bacterium]
MVCSRRRGCHGFTLVELLIVIVIIGLLASIAIPNLISAHRKARYARAASESKTLVTQAILYGNDQGVYPTSVAVLRGSGYANMADVDPWNLPWQLSPALTSGAPPRQTDDVYMFSKGAGASGVFPDPFVSFTGDNGSVGFSSIYGSWSGA